MNQVILIGRLTSDPDLRFFPSGIALSRFHVAISRSYKKNSDTITDFIPIEIWGKKAEYCATYISKGTLVAINGELHFDKYVDSNEMSRTFAKVVAFSISKLSTPANSANKVDSSALELSAAQTVDSDDVPMPDFGETSASGDTSQTSSQTPASTPGENSASNSTSPAPGATPTPQNIKIEGDDLPF